VARISLNFLQQFHSGCTIFHKFGGLGPSIAVSYRIKLRYVTISFSCNNTLSLNFLCFSRILMFSNRNRHLISVTKTPSSINFFFKTKLRKSRARYYRQVETTDVRVSLKVTEDHKQSCMILCMTVIHWSCLKITSSSVMMRFNAPLRLPVMTFCIIRY